MFLALTVQPGDIEGLFSKAVGGHSPLGKQNTYRMEDFLHYAMKKL